MFAPLHTKTHFSAGYGAASIEELVSRAHGHGYPALALTDIENLYGQVQFHCAARQYGIKPITGVELRAGYSPGSLGRKEGRLILLARSREGYESLCRIITQRRGFPQPANDDPIRCLEAEPRGLFFLSDDAAVLSALIRAGVPEADIRFLLVRPGEHPIPGGIRVVADPDVVMASPDDWKLHLLQVAIRLGQKVSEVTETEPPERSLPDRQSVQELFRDMPEALVESLHVAEACNFDLTALQKPPVGDECEQAAADRLERLCRQRFLEGRRRDLWQESVYEQRLDKELATLRQLEFSSYFLVAGEIANQARREGIRIAGRGSASSSLVAHVLGITAVDPIKHGLYFERFIHSSRRDFPDIDMDVPSNRRDELIDWVFQHFGQEKVAMVSAHQRFGTRAAFRAGLKALGLGADAVSQFCERIPDDDIQPVSDLPIHLLPEGIRSSVPLIRQLVGKLQHISVHPGGIVVAPPRVDQFTPLERAPKGVLMTQYDMRSLAELGLVKIDLLGNRALSVIQDTLPPFQEPIEMQDGDPETLNTLQEANTIGCFQIETPALRSVLKRLPVRGITDLVAALAIVRPGPASGEAKAAFIRRANGNEPPKASHPRLESRLRETYGMMLYEEDLMSAISVMTNWSLEKADEMRAAILSAQDDAAERFQLKQAFLNTATEIGVTLQEGEAVWKILARFAAYSFNKAHATSYAQIAWQTAYLKTHFPVRFASGVLNHYGGHYPLRSVAADFVRQGVPILGPHLNYSQTLCAVESGAVRIGLSSIKYLSAKKRKWILERRPFQDMRDFLQRVRVSYRELEALVLSGACDNLMPLTGDAYPIVHEDLLAILKKQIDPDVLNGFVPRRLYGPRKDLYSALVRVRNELRFLNMHPSCHPIQLLREEAVREGCITTGDLSSHAGQVVRVAGLVASTRRLLTTGNQIMQFVTFEDEHGLVEAVLFPKTYKILDDPVTNPGPYLVTGRVAEDRNDVHLVVSQVMPFHQRSHPYGLVNR